MDNHGLSDMIQHVTPDHLRRHRTPSLGKTVDLSGSPTIERRAEAVSSDENGKQTMHAEAVAIAGDRALGRGMSLTLNRVFPDNQRSSIAESIVSSMLNDKSGGRPLRSHAVWRYAMGSMCTEVAEMLCGQCSIRFQAQTKLELALHYVTTEPINARVLVDQAVTLAKRLPDHYVDRNFFRDLWTIWAMLHPRKGCIEVLIDGMVTQSSVMELNLCGLITCVLNRAGHDSKPQLESLWNGFRANWQLTDKYN